MQKISYKKFKKVSQEALIPAAIYINKVIKGEIDLSDYLTKGDRTVVTTVDKKSQDISRPIILSAYSEIRLDQEESKVDVGNLKSSLKIYHDPLDGTGSFLIGGSNPTIILSLYDSKNKKILAVSTMEPSTGRFWFSSEGNGAWTNVFDYHKQDWLYAKDKQIKVNNQDIDGSRILVDVSHPFKRKLKTKKLKEILTQKGRRELSNQIEKLGAKETSMNSNGVHYALVASGRPTLVGNITTAIGGPFDISGMLHVIEAGGVAKCYGISDEREFYELENPEDIEKADIAIAANNQGNLKKIEEIISNAVENF